MADVTLPLAELPAKAGALVKAMAGAGARLARASASALAERPRELLILGGATLSWRFQATADRTRRIFFFWTKQTGIRVVARADVTLRIAPTDVELFTGSDRGGAASLRIVRPSILVHHPSPDELPATPPFDLDGAVLFRAGPGGHDRILAGASDEIGYFHGGSWRIVERTGVFARRWEAEPFFALVRALNEWLRADGDAGPAVPLAEAVDRSTTQVLLAQIAATYAAVTAGPIAVDAPAERLDEALERAIPAYAVTDFAATLKLRLDEDGELTAGDEHNPYGLELRVRGVDDAVAPYLRLTPGPPDFLVAGALHQAFVDAVVERADADLARDLGFRSLSELQSFLSDAAEAATFFRVSQSGDVDVDAAVLPGAGGARTIMLRIESRVDAAASPPGVDVSKIGVLYDDAKQQDSRLDGDTVDYFFRLLAALRSWSAVLG